MLASQSALQNIIRTEFVNLKNIISLKDLLKFNEKSIFAVVCLLSK